MGVIVYINGVIAYKKQKERKRKKVSPHTPYIKKKNK